MQRTLEPRWTVLELHSDKPQGSDHDTSNPRIWFMLLPRTQPSSKTGHGWRLGSYTTDSNILSARIVQLLRFGFYPVLCTAEEYLWLCLWAGLVFREGACAREEGVGVGGDILRGTKMWPCKRSSWSSIRASRTCIMTHNPMHRQTLGAYMLA